MQREKVSPTTARERKFVDGRERAQPERKRESIQGERVRRSQVNLRRSQARRRSRSGLLTGRGLSEIRRNHKRLGNGQRHTDDDQPTLTRNQPTLNPRSIQKKNRRNQPTLTRNHIKNSPGITEIKSKKSRSPDQCRRKQKS